MGREKLKSVTSCFTPDGEYLAILSPNRTVKIWSTSKGSVLAELKELDDNPDVSYSCMACVGKKRGRGSLVALGTGDGDILAFNVLTGQKKWKAAGHHPGGVAGLSFANKGRSLYSVGTNGMTSEINSETGEILREFKTSKKSISSLAFSADEKILAVAGSRLRVFSLEDGKEIMKFPDELGTVNHISISDDAKTVVTSESGVKTLQVWRCDFSSRNVSSGPVLSMRHPPLSFECKNGCNGEGASVITAVSESGAAYVWHLKTISEDEINPTKVTVKAQKDETNQQISGSVKKSRTSIIAARLNALESDERVTSLIAHGSIDSPQFSLVDISSPGENIVLTATKETGTEDETGILSTKGSHDLESEAAVTPTKKKKASKKRAASDLDLATTTDMADTGHGEVMDGVDDLNEPTMGEKLASLNLLDADKTQNQEKQESSLAKPPSADSVHVLLKQALRADDRALLLDCLYTQDQKVIANSTSLLNPSDVLKLLHSLVSIIHSRGAVVACALPWLRSLLLQHASKIMSQESSLVALNSIYQLIESRVSTFQPALELSSHLDFLYGQTADDEDEGAVMVPAIYEDNSEEDEEPEDDAMETDEDEGEDGGEALVGEALDGLISDIEGSLDDMSD